MQESLLILEDSIQLFFLGFLDGVSTLVPNLYEMVATVAEKRLENTVKNVESPSARGDKVVIIVHLM